MTKKQKTWLIIGSVAGSAYMTISVIAVIFGIVLIFYDPFLASKLVKYYSNDDNFHKYSGTISVYSKEQQGYLKFQKIEPLEENAFPKPNKNEVCKIYSPDLNQTWTELNPYEGMQIEFYGTFAVFFDGCFPAIIQITVDGHEILNYNDGKAALIEWASHMH